MKEIEVMVASHRKTQAIRKKLEIIIKRIQSQQETAWELQGALKKILHNERIYCSWEMGGCEANYGVGN